MSVSDRAIAIEKKRRHDELCRAISKDLPTFIRVGSHLIELRDLEVYKETHKTFETFALDQFGLERAQAYRLIDAATVSANLSPIGDKVALPATESQYREVAKAPPEKQAEVVKKAAEIAAEQNRQPTAKDYKQVVGELLLEGEGPAVVEAPSPPVTAAKPAPVATHHPKEMAGPLMAHVSTLTKMLNDLKKRTVERGGEWIDIQLLSTQVSDLKYSLKSAIYYGDCPDCQGKGCVKCRQSGFLPELKSAIVEAAK